MGLGCYLDAVESGYPFERVDGDEDVADQGVDLIHLVRVRDRVRKKLTSD